MKKIATIKNASNGTLITGKVANEYEKGLTIEDSRGIIYYATFDRVLEIKEIEN